MAIYRVPVRLTKTVYFEVSGEDTMEAADAMRTFASEQREELAAIVEQSENRSLAFETPALLTHKEVFDPAQTRYNFDVALSDDQGAPAQ